MILELALGTIGALIAGGTGARIGLTLWRHLESVRTDVATLKTQRLELQERARRDAIHTETERVRLEQSKIDRARLIYPDPDNGLYPLIMVDSRTVYDPALAALANVTEGLKGVDPRLAVPEQRRRILEAMAGLGAPGQRAALEGESNGAADLPSRVPGSWALQQLGRPSFSNLALGVAMRDGQAELVRGDMTKLVHVGCGGSSGTGKSVFARWMAYQLVIGGDVDLCMVDLELATFAPFTNCERLLWPVADTERDALAVFDALVGEMERRKVLYSEYPGVDSLPVYNDVSGDTLRPIVCLVDEATALLASRPVNVALRTLALRARKFGVWLTLFGQDWRGASLDIAIRNQLGGRLSFKTMSKSQSHVLLGCPDAYDLDASKPGRAVAVLPGLGKIKLQTPMIARDDILATMTGSGPRGAMPEPEPTEAESQAEMIRELADQGLSQSQIEQEVFGYCGGAAYAAVKAALSDNSTN